MLSTLFNLSVILEWVTFIAAIFLLDKKTGIWQLFIYFLIFTICVETTGWYLYNVLDHVNNHWVYNGFNLVSNIFSIYILSQAPQIKSLQHKIFRAIVFFVLLFVVNVFVQMISKYNNYAEEIGNIFCVVVCCIFYYKLLNDEQHVPLFKNEYFWFATGLFFDSFGSAVVNPFYNTLKAIHLQTGVSVFTYTMNALDVILYGCFIISFICRRINSR